MLSYLFFSSTSILCIFQLKKILEIYSEKFAYFKTVILLTFFLLILSNIGLFKYLYIIKFLIFLSLLWFIYNKQIKINLVDQVFFFSSFFLVYYNYNTFFTGTDVLNGFGYFSKYLFLNKTLPIGVGDEFIANGKYSLPQILFHNFFLSGSNFFSEELCNFSNNIFLLLNFIIIFEIYKSNKNYIHLAFALGIFYLLINIFGGEGKTIRTEELSILLYFSLAIFIIKINTLSFFNCSIVTISLLLALLNKVTSIFFIFLPFSLLFLKFYNDKYFLTKIVLSFTIAFLTFSYVYKIQSNEMNYNNFRIGIAKLNNDFSFEKPDPSKTVIIITSYKFNDLIKSLIHKDNIDNSQKIFLDMFDTETYKASFSIGRKIFNNLDIFSLDLKKWFLLFSISLIIIFFKRKNLKINYIYFFILYLVFVINFSASYINEISRNLTSNKKYEINKLNDEINENSKYLITYSKPAVTDYGRYNGWSILMIFLFLTYYFYNYEKKKLKYILIFLMLITPLRAYGNLIKIYKYNNEDNEQKIKKMSVFNQIKNKNANNCLDRGTLFILDFDNKKNTAFNRTMRSLKYYNFEKRLAIYAVDSLFWSETSDYDKILDYNFEYLRENNNVQCLITYHRSEVDGLISTRYKKIYSKDKFNFYQIEKEL